MFNDISPVKSVVLANVIEYNHQTMSSGFSDAELLRWHQGGADLSDMALFWCGDDKLVITPYSLNKAFVADVQEFMGYENIQLASPSKTSNSICEDVIADLNLFSLVVDIMRRSNKTKLISWGATKEFYILSEQLKREGISFETPEIPPPQNYWTVRYLESKTGFREFCQKLRKHVPEIRLPEGYICSNKECAIDVMSHFCSRQREFVLKANYGTGGYSMLCYNDQKLSRGQEWLKKDITRRMSFDQFWSNQPVVLEEYIHRVLMII